MSAGDIALRRLGPSDIGPILQLLNSTWPDLYGATGCPVFSHGYLSWLYAGPRSDRHYLLGAYRSGVLVGFKAYLYRPLVFKERRVTGYIATHLAIDPTLQLGERMALAKELGKLHPLNDEEPEYQCTSEDRAVLSFFEQGKSLIRNVKKLHNVEGIHTSYLEFQQAIVNPRELEKSESSDDGLAVRECTSHDIREALTLLETAGRFGISLQPDPEELWHHVSRAPRGRAWVAERGEQISGFLACYLLETMKDNRQSRTMIVEILCSPEANAIRKLLSQAVDYGRSCGARGVVIENTTFLSEADCRQMGIVATPRRMVLALRSRSSELENVTQFVCDVK